MENSDIARGRVEAIWIKRAHRGPMDAVTEATAVEGAGLLGSVDRSKRRQITLIDGAAWRAALDEISGDAEPSRRRANVLLSGIELEETRKRILRLGDEVRIAIGGELTPCERMDEVLPGLRSAMRPHWRGGVFGQVLSGGLIRIGDVATWEAMA
jgi:MOSC domain-containing protein YiiM